MRIALKTKPSQIETIMIKMIFNDMLLGFFFLMLAITGTVIYVGFVLYEGLFEVQTLVLIVPTIAIFSFVVILLRFYGYLRTVWRVWGALGRVRKEFDLPDSDIVVDFNPPLILFRGMLNKYAQKTEKKPQGMMIAMRGRTDKYAVQLSCQLVKGKFKMVIFVRDWHGLSHKRDAEGKISKIHVTTMKLIEEIRRDVLEARGLDIAKIRAKSREFISFPSAPPVKVAAAKAEPKETKTRSIPVDDFTLKKAPSPALAVPKPVKAKARPVPMEVVERPVPKAEPAAKPAPKKHEKEETAVERLEHSLQLLEGLKTAETVPHHTEMAVHEEKLKTQVEKAKTPKEKKETQDALFQVQELKKVIKKEQTEKK